MDNVLDPWLLAVACLVVVLVIVVPLYAAKSKRARECAAKLEHAEGEAHAATDLSRRYEAEARAATELRVQLVQAQAQAGAAWELAQRYEPDALMAPTLRAEIDRLAGQLARYQPLLDAEAELARVRQETSSVADQMELTRRAAHGEIQSLQAQLTQLRIELGPLENEVTFQSYGLYTSKYDFENSSAYQDRLEHVRAKQKEMTTAGNAAICETEWVVAGSAKEGRKMTSDWLKLMLRAFNGECDAAVAKVKYSNFAAMSQRIEKTFEKVNKLGTSHHCQISPAYLALKQDELTLFHEYQQKLQDEREEQRAINEQIREEKRANEEIERAKRKAEEEEARYAEALEKARADVERSTGAKHDKLMRQITELEGRLAEAQENKRAISLAEQTRAGHVYVISNIGSFGEHVYKIGMTRRLDPQDRVKELGDASVPFPFDVHAIISTTDAPKLENELHKMFAARRLNTVNLRKEFFNVTLGEIEAGVCRHHGTIEFTKIAEASEWRSSVATRDQARAKPTQPTPAVSSSSVVAAM